MAAHPNLIFSAFKEAAAAAMKPAESYGPSGVGDSMKTFRAERRNPPQWTEPNSSQATPNDNPIAAQKTAPPPPVQ